MTTCSAETLGRTCCGEERVGLAQGARRDDQFLGEAGNDRLFGEADETSWTVAATMTPPGSTGLRWA